MLTIDDDNINDRFEKGDVGHGFVSAAEDDPAEVRPSALSSWG